MTTRTKVDIISQILETASSGVSTKSKIMNRANLNYEQLKEYLKTLYDMNLLSYNADSHTFKTTEKGFRFLETYYKLDDVIQSRRTTTANLRAEIDNI
jgi:predicted transcriptional regulator